MGQVRPAPTDVERLRMEHEAMASTLCEAENLVSKETMIKLRLHYMEAIMAARDYAGRS